MAVLPLQQRQVLGLNFKVFIIFLFFSSCENKSRLHMNYTTIFSNVELIPKISSTSKKTYIVELHGNTNVPPWIIYYNKDNFIDSTVYNNFIEDTQVSMDWKVNIDFSRRLKISYPNIFEKITIENNFLTFSSKIFDIGFLTYKSNYQNQFDYLKEVKRDLNNSGFKFQFYKKHGENISYAAFDTTTKNNYKYYTGWLKSIDGKVYDFQFRYNEVDEFIFNIFDIIISNIKTHSGAGPH